MFEQALADLDVEKFWELGYALLPNAYSDEEIEKMRDEARAQNKRGGELATGPLAHVLTDGRMVEVAKKLLGTDDILYGGDSSATINGVIRVWHKDNTDRQDEAAPDWDDRYTQLRFGVYLQDHTAHTGGLNLKVGSHDICDLTSGETIYVRNRPGDLLVWSMRMTHSGAGTLLKDASQPDPEPTDWEKFSDDEVQPAHDERMAIFAHLGANDKHGRRYLDYLKTRTYMVNAWRKAPMSPEVIAELEAAGLTVRDMPAEVMDDKRAGLDVQWQPYWYPGRVEATPAAAPAPVATKPKPKAKPKPAPQVEAPAPAEPESAVARYGRAAQRRLAGAARGAKQGWATSAADPKKRKAAAAKYR